MTGRAGVVLLAAVGFVAGQSTLAIPSWLEPLPGATPRTHDFTTFVEQDYKTDASPADVVAHYRKLFDAAKLPFFPQIDPISTTIHGDTPECDLKVDIRRFSGATLVHVTCSQPTLRKRQEDGMRAMAKYDQPVYPQTRTKAQLPPLTWPTWLVQCDSSPLQAHRGVDRFKLSYLSAEYDCAADRTRIQTFYADLLSSNGYTVTAQTPAFLPRGGTAIVEGARYFGDRLGPRFVVRVELTAVEGAFHVDLRITARP